MFTGSKTGVYIWSMVGTNCRKLLRGNRIPHSCISLQNTYSNCPQALASLGTTCSSFQRELSHPNQVTTVLMSHIDTISAFSQNPLLLTVIKKDWKNNLLQPKGWSNFKLYHMYAGNQKQWQLPDCGLPTAHSQASCSLRKT